MSLQFPPSLWGTAPRGSGGDGLGEISSITLRNSPTCRVDKRLLSLLACNPFILKANFQMCTRPHSLILEDPFHSYMYRYTDRRMVDVYICNCTWKFISHILFTSSLLFTPLPNFLKANHIVTFSKRHCLGM